jgi:FAD/FMN-containing dehydrogenase
VREPRSLLERLLGPEGVGRDPGGMPRALPDTAEHLAEVLQLAGREGWEVRLEGRGSWLAADAPATIAISTRALDEIFSLDVAAGRVTVAAGLSLETLGRRLADRGFWLPWDPPGRPDRSVGSVLATGTAGPLRAAFGSPTAALERCVLATGDGRLLELAGDAARAHATAFGASGPIAEVTLRVRPLPEGDLTLTAMGPRDDLTKGARDALAAGSHPAAFELWSPTAAAAPDWVLAARFLGPAPLIAAERSHLIQAAALPWTEHPAERAPALWGMTARAPLGGAVTVRLAALPDGLDETIDLVGDHLDEGLISVGLRDGLVRWSGRAEAKRLRTLRRVAAAREIPVTLERAPWPLRTAVPHFGPYRESGTPAPGWRRQFDPGRRFLAPLHDAEPSES